MNSDNADFKESYATVRVPGSKSLSQRALVASALAKGDSAIHNVLVSEDTTYLMEGLKSLGADIVPTKNGFSVCMVSIAATPQERATKKPGPERIARSRFNRCRQKGYCPAIAS